MSKSKSLTKALGIKQEQPEQLKKALAKGAGKETRFKPGDPRLVKNKGQRNQIVPNRTIFKTRNQVSAILKEIQDKPITKELAKLLGLPENVTIAQAIALSLVFEALKGDVSAIKHLQLNTENLRDGAPAGPVGPPPSLSIVWVKPDGTKVKESQQRQLDSPAPALELEMDYTGDTKCPEGYRDNGHGVFEQEPEPPFADTEENKQ